MNKIFSTLLLICFSCVGFAQDVNSSSDSVIMSICNRNQLVGNNLTIDVRGNLASNFLSRDIILMNYWSNEIIDDQIDRLKKNNFGGFEVQSDIYLNLDNKHLKALGNVSPWFGVHNVLLVGISTNQDLLKLVLRGNADNRNISFTDKGFATEVVGYSQLSFGFKKVKKQSELSFGVGLLMGNTRIAGEIKSGTLSTSDGGDVISANNVDFGFWQAKGGITKGLGAALHFEYSKCLNSKNRFTVKIQDLGIIRWNEVLSYKSRNQSFNYEGFDVTGFWNDGYSFEFQDSLEEKYILKEKKPQTTLAPGIIGLHLEHIMNRDHYLKASAQYRYITGYLPMFSGAYGRYYDNSIFHSMEVGINAGGFGVAAIHFGTELNLGSKIRFKLEVSGVENLAIESLPVYWGTGAGLSFRW